MAVHRSVVTRFTCLHNAQLLGTHATKQHVRRSKPLHGHCSNQQPGEQHAQYERSGLILLVMRRDHFACPGHQADMTARAGGCLFGRAVHPFGVLPFGLGHLGVV